MLQSMHEDSREIRELVADAVRRIADRPQGCPDGSDSEPGDPLSPEDKRSSKGAVMIDRRPIMLKGGRPFILDIPAHSDEHDTGHVYKINESGESVCECGHNMGVLTWTTEKLYRHYCECGWVNQPIPAVDTCPECGTDLNA